MEPQNLLDSFASALEEMWHHPRIGFDKSLATIHADMTYAFKVISSADRIAMDNPGMALTRQNMHTLLALALRHLHNCRQDTSDHPEFKQLVLLLSATERLAEQVHHEFIMTLDVLVGDGNLYYVASVFSKNLKKVIEEMGITLDRFINRGPFPNSRQARDIVEGRTLPGLGIVRHIAEYLRVDIERLLKGISKPELLNTTV